MSAGLSDTARELQSDMRRLDRSLKELENEAKKLEKQLHALEPEREPPADERDYAVDLANVASRDLARIAKLVAGMRSLAEPQLAGIDRILANIAVLERYALTQPKLDTAASSSTLASNHANASVAAATAAATVAAAAATPLKSGPPAATASAGSSGPSKVRSKRDAAALSSPPTVAAAAAAAPRTPEPSSDADVHVAKKARPQVAQKGMHSADAPPREGELVAARDARSEGYLLARVLQYLPTKQKYNVEDADPTITSETGRRTFMCGLNEISALRKPDNEYKAGTRVLAMFPETSMFYHAVVVEPPSVNENSKYLVRFEDDEDEDTGQTPHREISPRDVVRAKS